jgi:predicted DNA-binding transcriptional regulator AlpA
MLHFIPKALPALTDLLGDCGNPRNALLAAALGVKVRTVERWIKAGEAPRPVMLALFWVTRWGRSAVDAQAVNDATLYAAQARCLRDENLMLRTRIARLESLADSRGGAANDAFADQA